MAVDIPNSPHRGSGRFQKVVDAFLSSPGLPFAEILSAERIERIFARHGCLFGQHGVYTTAIMVWSFLSQVLRDGKEASCQSAVARVVSYCAQAELDSPTQDTGDYCRARAKLSEAALHELSSEVTEELEQAADASWLWKDRYHAKLIDGFTFTMPDTPKNQAKYPHPKTQKPGVGLPIARAVAILSLATACVTDLAMGPYKGKETGESALLRSMLGSLAAGDIAVMDRYYCSFMMIALLLSQGTHTCARKHHLRHSDFRRGRRLGKYDHIIVWMRPQRPKWMDEETYAQIPETLELREIRFNIVERGRRTRTIDVITTLLDADEYSKEEIAALYGFRWNSELDIRSIKDSLNLGHVRCKSPEMVHREVWTTILGYNLIRATAAGAALLHGKQPRQISFTSTCQYVLASWMQLSAGLIDASSLDDYLRLMLKQIAACEVANRPGRLEPRVLKRRRHGYKLMQKPRNQLRRELRKQCT
ncbi:MAG: IS4 family transposase [Pseudomonas sp.]|uniref:IS4 family transposase n=1 Tax=Pseudomonas sp. TaxID=306 RepID=UPI003C74FC95